MDALAKIRHAGFQVSLSGDSFKIAPSSKLDENQRAFLKSHKSEIISNLRAEQAVNEIIRNLVTCYSPSGLVYEIEARDEEHAAWLQRMNPPPIGKQS